MKHFSLAALVLTISASLAACSGGAPGTTANSSLPAAPAASRHGKAAVKLRFVIARPYHRHRDRRGRFVSPSTNGVQILAWPHGATHTVGTAIANVSVDVSSGSAACGGQTGYPRTCSVTLNLAPQNDDFTIYGYDTAPSSGVIPPAAHLLGLGNATLQIVAGKANALALYMGGVVTGLSGQKSFVSVASNGNAANVSFVIDPSDFGNNPITAGTNDPLANPIVASVTESGGTGHAGLSLNGAAPQSSVTVSHTSDQLQLVYDGQAGSGYSDAVSLAAPAINSFGGASESVTVSPLIASTVFYRPSNGNLTLPLGKTTTLDLTEAGAPGTTTYTVAVPTSSPNGCNSGTGNPGVALSTVTGTGTSASLTVGTNTTLSSTGCTLTIGDSNGTTEQMPLQNGEPGVPVDEFPVTIGKSAYPQLTRGPDGAMWFTTGSGLARIPTNATPGSGAQISTYPVPEPNPTTAGIMTGPDGQIWFSDCNTAIVGKIPVNATPGSSAQVTTYLAKTGHPFGLATGPDGNVWYGDFYLTGVNRMTPSGQIVAQLPTTREYTNFFVSGPDGAVWFDECQNAPNGLIGRVTTTNAVQEFGTSNGILASAEPNGVAVGPDGNIWFADCSHANPAIGKVDLHNNEAITEFLLPANARPEVVVAGPDGAIWFTDCGFGAIGRIPTNATTSNPQITEYPVPTASANPYGIALGGDGGIWFTEGGANKIGRLTVSGADVRSTFKAIPARAISAISHYYRRHKHRRFATPQ